MSDKVPVVPQPKTRVIHMSEPHDVYIGRPSKWGNPFSIGEDGTRSEVLGKYRLWLETQPDLIEEMKTELNGKVLGCWCQKGQSCHGHIIIEIIHGHPRGKPLF